MFLTALYFIPCFVSLLWAFSFCLKVRNQRQTFFMTMLFIEAFYYATTAVYLLPGTDYDLMVRMDAVCIPVIFAILAMMFVYIYLLQPSKKLSALHLICFFPAAIFGTLVNLMYLILGFDSTARLIQSRDEFGTLTGEFDTELYRLYVFIDDNLISIAAFIFTIAFLIHAFSIMRKCGYRFGDIYRFLTKGIELNPSIPKVFLQVAVLVVLTPYSLIGRKFMSDHILLTSAMMMLLAVIKHLSSHMEYHAYEAPKSFYQLTHIEAPDSPKAAEEAVVEEAEVQQVPEASVSRADLLQQRFTSEMESGAFREDDLSLQSMADRLGVSTRTLSNMVNGSFGVPFRDIVNKYRIEEAKRYMLSHPDATQSTVAFECGYKNDSVFNKKFKEAEGMTPLMWITRNATS